MPRSTFERCERLLTLALALAVDHRLGEPPRWIHPVVWIGKLIDELVARAPSRGPKRQLLAGAAMTGGVVGLASLGGWLAGHVPIGAARLVLGVWLLKSTFAERALFEAAAEVDRSLAGGDLAGARAKLTALVSRPTADLDEPLIVAAAIESVGENASDSFVAPLSFYLLGGLPAALAYRAVNTLDAMIGYRGHYDYLGKAAARLDDVLNFVPARLTALLIAVAARPSGRFGTALTIARRDAGRTASPNAGWPMAALAGALGVELEKVGHYRLGDAGRPLTVVRLREAMALVKRALALWTAACLGVELLRTIDHGPWTMDDGRWTMDHGRSRLGRGSSTGGARRSDGGWIAFWKALRSLVRRPSSIVHGPSSSVHRPRSVVSRDAH